MLGLGSVSLLFFTYVLSAPIANCPYYTQYANTRHKPFSSGQYKLPSMRPKPSCRTFTAPEVDEKIVQMKSAITDPDLYQLFSNTFPNTLDTTIKYKGYASGSDEEITFVITGDIDAMWLRDSANQMQSYLSLLKANSSADSLASVWRGVINLQARYVTAFPYCNSFQPPPESGLEPQIVNGGDNVMPPYNSSIVYECKYELDSLAAFLQVSTEYYDATGDGAFFGKYGWVKAVQTLLKTVNDMMTPTYAANGKTLRSPYTFTRYSAQASETLENSGLGNPVQRSTGLIRSDFRPSDDATIFQLFIPANMMLSRYLASTAKIMRQIGHTALSEQMTTLSTSLQQAIDSLGITPDPNYGDVYSYEVDGYSSSNMMDDANIPSLLSAPFIGYLNRSDPVYLNTRTKILSADNPYFMRGPVINAVGGAHIGPGMAWPMASIVRILTSDNDDEIYSTLKELVSSTDGLGLMHESINSFDQEIWTRSWFAWANGLFGQMILDLKDRKPALLKRSYQ